MIKVVLIRVIFRRKNNNITLKSEISRLFFDNIYFRKIHLLWDKWSIKIVICSLNAYMLYHNGS